MNSHNDTGQLLSVLACILNIIISQEKIQRFDGWCFNGMLLGKHWHNIGKIHSLPMLKIELHFPYWYCILWKTNSGILKLVFQIGFSL